MNSEVVKIGFANLDEEYPIIFESQSTDLIKIRYEDKEGYIPKDSGQLFWAIPDYKK